MKKAKLKSTDIIKKEFQVEYQGYDCNEVDLFLDMVASDYRIFESQTEDLLQEIKFLKQKNKDLEDKNKALEVQIDLIRSQKSKLEEEKYSNADLIKRIHDLEGKIKNK